jgi:hypothetical protein
MAFVLKLLKAGQTNNGTATTLYTVPAATSAIISNIRFVNTSGSSATVNLFFKPGGSGSVRILDKDKSVPSNDLLVVKPELTLAATDVIEATTSVAMDCVVCGMEKV